MDFVWVYNHLLGALQRWPRPYANVLLRLPGWHGPFNTKEEAVAFYDQGKASNPTWKAPTGFLDNLGNLPSAYRDTAKEYFKGIDLQAWLLRIGEILLGIVLIGVGVIRITNVDVAGVTGKLTKVLV